MTSKLYAASLVPLAAIGFYGLHILSSENGLYELISSLTEKRVLADGITPWPQWLGGPPALERLAGALLGFFWPVVNAESPTAVVTGISFAGQFVGAWTVILLEGYRTGLRKSAASWTTIYGQLVQFVGIAVICPVFLFINLLTSPLVDNPSPANVAISDDRYIKAVPFALLAGFIVPSVMTVVKYPDHLSNDPKIAAVLVWQLFPIITAILIGVLSSILPSSTSRAKGPSSQLPLLRRAYAFGLVCSAITHVAVVTLSVASVVTPDIFSAKYGAQFSPAAVFLPSLSTAPTPSIAIGALDFLKWDYAGSAAANLVWAFAITAPVRRSGSYASPFSLGNAILDLVVRTALFGPFAATLTFVWERDEAVLGAEHKKKN